MQTLANYATASLIWLVAASSPAVAQDYERFPTYVAHGWTVGDKGEERCNADFAIGGHTVLSFMGPYYHGSGKLEAGSIIHLGEVTYTLPKGDRYGDFAVQLFAGPGHFAVSGFATDLNGALVVNSGSLPTVAALLAALPDKVTLKAMVGDSQVYAVELTGNQAAAKALDDCTAFITAQKRPGTKSGPSLGDPKPPTLEVLRPPAEGPPEPSDAVPTAPRTNVVPPS